VLLGSLAKISLADLLIAGILPGLLVAALFFAYVIVRCSLDPSLAPGYSVERVAAWQRWCPFLVNVVPLLAIFVAVVGSMLGGLATASESAALGAFASLVAAACYGRLTWRALVVSLVETGKISAMIFLIAAA